MRKIVLTGAAALALVAGGTAAGAAIASGPVDSSGVVHGCYGNENAAGTIHDFVLVDAGTACPTNMTPIEWSQTGPQGTTGPQGPQGPAGATGAIGPQGPAGLAGVPGLNGSNGTNGSNIVTSPGAPSGFCNAGDTDVDLADGEVYSCNVAAVLPNFTWADTGFSIEGPAGPAGAAGAAGAAGTPGAGATVAQLASGNPNCASGGASITDGNGNTAYACTGATGAAGPPGAPGTVALHPNATVSNNGQDVLASVNAPSPYVNVPGLGLALPNTNGGLWFVTASVGVSVLDGDPGTVSCALFLDGSDAGYGPFLGSVDSSLPSTTIPVTAGVSVSPGTHLVDVRCSVGSGGRAEFGLNSTIMGFQAE
jgi:hypothetical protein